jgi:Chlorite dismutase
MPLVADPNRARDAVSNRNVWPINATLLSIMSEPQHGQSVDVLERGAARDGVPQTLDRRLFMQLLVFDCARELKPSDALQQLRAGLVRRAVPHVIYEDINQPAGIGLLTWSEQPLDFATKVRPVFGEPDLAGLVPRPDFSMLGRTYSSGFEPDLEYWLLRRPQETVLNEAWPWAVWYPLRRFGAFERLEGKERGGIMREHAGIGKSYAGADLAHDVRLACHGLDPNDNDFVIGLIGKELHPLSHLVQSMRSTRQTSEFIQKMGPFFVGRAASRSA